MKKIFLTIFAIILLAPCASFACEGSADDKVLISKPVGDDLYAAGASVQVFTDVHGDLISAGGNIFVQGDIKQDLMLAGGDIGVDGKVMDDARLFGGNVIVSADIDDDLLMFGGNITLLESGSVGGDLIFAGGDVDIEGPVKGDVTGMGNSLYINNIIHGNVDLKSSDKIEFGPRGRVLGDFTYKTVKENEYVNKGNVKGAINFSKGDMPSEKDMASLFGAFLFGFSVISLLSYLFVGLFIVWLAKMCLFNTRETIRKRPGASFGYGLLIAVLTPIVILILIFSGIGIRAGMLTALAFFIMMCIGKLSIMYFAGSFILKTKPKNSFLKHYGAFALGALLFVGFGLMPFIGWIIKCTAALFGFGGALLYTKEIMIHLKKKKYV